MTFDEAIEKLEQLAKFEVGKTTGNIRRDFKLELGDARDLLTELREEYAPTVEMTSGNKATFVQEGDSLSKLLTGYFGFDVLYWGDFSERKVAQVWLHPETIKVVDE